MSLTSPIFLSSAPITSVPLNFDAKYWSCRCELTNFVEVADDDGLFIDEDDEDGCVVGDFISSAANAEPIIRPPMAVVIMSFFSIGDPPWTHFGKSNPLAKTTFGHRRCSGGGTSCQHRS